MGGYYAENSGESHEVSQAIRFHYYPNSPSDDLPGNAAGCIVSIADKLDTITGYFGIGSIPSGSQDPYALRRQANGIVRIIAESDFQIDLKPVVEMSVCLYEQFSDKDQIADKILEFLKGRVYSILSERGFNYDVIDSILTTGFTDVSDAIKRAEAVSRFRKRDDFSLIYPAFNRIIRILPAELKKSLGNTALDDVSVNEQWLEDKAEKKLYESMIEIESSIRQSAANSKYELVLNKLAELRNDIDNFFDEVLVMSQQENLRNNRLKLLQRLASMLYLVADFSKLVE
jgi:glycyl-tRNA synthetase beta chain